MKLPITIVLLSSGNWIVFYIECMRINILPGVIKFNPTYHFVLRDLLIFFSLYNIMIFFHYYSFSWLHSVCVCMCVSAQVQLAVLISINISTKGLQNICKCHFLYWKLLSDYITAAILYFFSGGLSWLRFCSNFLQNCTQDRNCLKISAIEIELNWLITSGKMEDRIL